MDQDVDPESVAWVFHPDRDRWRDAGFETWDDVKSWLQNGLEVHQATAFRRWMSGDEARPWIDAGFDDGWAAQCYADAGFSPDIAVVWRDAGVGAGEAARWHAVGFTPEERQSWGSAWKFPPDQARLWRDAGYVDAETAWQARSDAIRAGFEDVSLARIGGRGKSDLTLADIESREIEATRKQIAYLASRR